MDKVPHSEVYLPWRSTVALSAGFARNARPGDSLSWREDIAATPHAIAAGTISL
jgi:hypothetical protein